jgi:hypothetical protein
LLIEEIIYYFKTALPVEFSFRDLQNKICSTICTLSGSLTNATNSASFEMSVFHPIEERIFSPALFYPQIHQSHLLLFIQFLFAHCCQRKGLLQFVKQFCRRILLMQFILQMVPQAPEQGVRYFTFLCTQRTGIRCLKTFVCNINICLKCCLLCGSILSVGIEKFVDFPFMELCYELKCLWSKDSFIEWLESVTQI